MAIAIFACGTQRALVSHPYKGEVSAKDGSAADAEKAKIKEVKRSKSVDISRDLSCGQVIDLFGRRLNEARACTQTSQCKVLQVSAAGCWRLYNESFTEELSALSERIEQPQCRFMLPMYKCSASQPGEPKCQDGLCSWVKPAAN